MALHEKLKGSRFRRLETRNKKKKKIATQERALDSVVSEDVVSREG
jgi:hypothetical protein